MAEEWIDPIFVGQRPASEPNANYSAHFGVASHPNMFARMAGGPSLAQLMANRITPVGSISDPNRRTRARALANLYTPEELAAPRGTTYADYATRGELEGRRRAQVNSQLDQLHALDAELEAQRRKLDGQTKEAARAARFRAEHGRVAASLSGGSPTADLLGIIGTQVVLEVHDRRAASDRRKRILRVGRRGAAATRPLSTAGSARPNRTGALATRPFIASGESPARRSPVAISASEVGDSRSDPITASDLLTAPTYHQEELAAQVDTKRSTLQSPPSQPGLGSRWVQATLQALARPIRRARTQAPTIPELARINPATGLTALEQQGVESASSGPCDCPKPEKPRKKRATCSNPIISRSVKDGIITTKRELQCPPSKPK